MTNPLTASAARLMLLLAFAIPAAAQPLPPEALKTDYQIVEDAYRTLHPALTRYRSAEEIDEAFAQLEEDFGRDLGPRGAFLALSRFTAAIQCGHTYANFFNQSEDVQKVLFEGRDKLPLTFALLGRRMVVTHSATGDGLKAGDRIRAINGVPVGDILDALLAHTKGDGARDDARLYDLQVTGSGRYEPFDIYFPLLFPPIDDFYALELANGDTVDVRAVTAETRAFRLKALGVDIDASPDDKWAFRFLEDGTAYLKAGSFVTWKMSLDWRAFMDDAFQEMRAAGTRALILDMRGNSGGDNAVLMALLSHIASVPFTAPVQEERLAFDVVPERLRPHLGTWDPSFYDWRDKVTPRDGGGFVLAGEQGVAAGVPINPDAFSGKVVMLVDRAASSAVFTMARMLKESGRATLVGEETGGNQRGITGGAILFLTLPGTGLEVDIPLIGYYPTGDQPDAGIEPDIDASRTLSDIRTGSDSMLEKAIEAAAN